MRAARRTAPLGRKVAGTGIKRAPAGVRGAGAGPAAVVSAWGAAGWCTGTTGGGATASTGGGTRRRRSGMLAPQALPSDVAPRPERGICGLCVDENREPLRARRWRNLFPMIPLHTPTPLERLRGAGEKLLQKTKGLLHPDITAPDGDSSKPERWTNPRVQPDLRINTDLEFRYQASAKSVSSPLPRISVHSFRNVEATPSSLLWVCSSELSTQISALQKSRLGPQRKIVCRAVTFLRC